MVPTAGRRGQIGRVGGPAVLGSAVAARGLQQHQLAPPGAATERWPGARSAPHHAAPDQTRAEQRRPMPGRSPGHDRPAGPCGLVEGPGSTGLPVGMPQLLTKKSSLGSVVTLPLSASPISCHCQLSPCQRKYGDKQGSAKPSSAQFFLHRKHSRRNIVFMESFRRK